MHKSPPVSLEDDNFWDDCQFSPQLQPHSPYSISSKVPVLNLDAVNKLSNFRAVSPKSPAQEYSKKSKIIREALATEEINPKKRRDKKLTVIENMRMIYEKGMLLKELTMKNNDKIKKERELMNFDECTFKPKFYRNKIMENKLKNYSNMKIYQRSVKYKQKHIAKLARLNQEKYEKQNVPYPFTPTLNNNDLKRVFEGDEYFKEQIENDSNKIFLYRLMKAREEENYKKQKLENNIQEKFRINWNSPSKIKKCISQKEGLIFKQNLHDVLVNLKCDGEEEENIDNGGSNSGDETFCGEENNIKNKENNEFLSGEKTNKFSAVGDCDLNLSGKKSSTNN